MNRVFAALGGAAMSLLVFACASEPEADENTDRIEVSLYALCSRVWQTHQIGVCWENPEAVSADDRDIVRQGVAATWSSAANVDFVGWGACPQGVPSSAGRVGSGSNVTGILHIRAADEWPHVRKLGAQLADVQDGMVLNFTFKNWEANCSATEEERRDCVRHIAIHEFGHALGFSHEQNRPDTPKSCHDQPQGSNGDAMIGIWDANSVMNYCNLKWDNDGQLSELDTEGVRSIYGIRSSEPESSEPSSNGGARNSEPESGVNPPRCTCFLRGRCF